MSRRIAALFVSALLGVAVVVGLALSPLGWPVLVPYTVVVLVALGLLVRKAAGLRRAAEQPAGRTCTCCTSTVFDPVKVI